MNTKRKNEDRRSRCRLWLGIGLLLGLLGCFWWFSWQTTPYSDFGHAKSVTETIAAIEKTNVLVATLLAETQIALTAPTP